MKEVILVITILLTFTLMVIGGSIKNVFFYIRSEGGGLVSANPKNPYQKILRWSKNGEGGSQFFD